MIEYSTMKINPNYKMREIAGLTTVVKQGTGNINMTRIISFNKSAKLLFETLSGKEFSVEDAADVLVERYGIEVERAIEDVGKWISSLRECGIIEDE